jgi:transposase InsO family protein
VAIDRTSKFAFVKLVEKAGKMAAAKFLREFIEAVPYKIHTVLTDNGVQFTNRACDRYAFQHIFDRVCEENGIEHRKTKVNHPWSLEDQKTVQWTVFPTNGQVERMNRTIKDATVKRYHYADHDQLRQHLDDFIAAYNYARRLKTLRGLTPYENIVRCWTEKPKQFRVNPAHHMPGPNT